MITFVKKRFGGGGSGRFGKRVNFICVWQNTQCQFALDVLHKRDDTNTITVYIYVCIPNLSTGFRLGLLIAYPLQHRVRDLTINICTKEYRAHTTIISQVRHNYHRIPSEVSLTFCFINVSIGWSKCSGWALIIGLGWWRRYDSVFGWSLLTLAPGNTNGLVLYGWKNHIVHRLKNTDSC